MSTVIHFAVTASIVAEKFEFKILIIKKDTGASERQPQTKLPDLTFVASGKKIPLFTPTDLKTVYRNPSKPKMALLQTCRILRTAALKTVP